MIMKRHRLIAIPIAVSAVLTIAVGVAAAGFVSGLMPGNSTNGASTVMAEFIDDQGDNISIQAQSGVMSFRPRGGGPAVVENTTMVTVDAFTPTGLFGSACWTTPSQPFTIRANDNSATMTFDSSAPGVQPCPGQLVSNAVPGQGSFAPFSIDQGVESPVTFSVQWTPSGVTTTSHFNSTVTCLSWLGIFHGNQIWQNSNATAQVGSFTVDGLDQTGTEVRQSFAGTFTTDFAVVTSFGSSQVVQGPSSGSCGPFGSS